MLFKSLLRQNALWKHPARGQQSIVKAIEQAKEKKQ